MAVFAVSCAVVHGAPSSVGVFPSVLNASSTATDSAAVDTLQATVAANVATLVADGASPTEAHVTTLNTNYGLLATAIGAFQDDIATGRTGNNTNVVLCFDAASVVTRSALRAAISALLVAVDGSNSLTP